MATLQWSKELELDVPAMDATHREFVEMLTQVEEASDALLLERWNHLIAHTVEHFGQEDRWMEATGFSTGNCHSTQHKVVLDIMREGQKRAESGDLAMVRGMTPELASWFSYHAQTMDAALAQHMAAVGFDIDSGQVRHAVALPAEPISGCGGACSSSSANAVANPGYPAEPASLEDREPAMAQAAA